jgi:hypothetical protein
MTSFTDPLNTQDPSCCRRKASSAIRVTRTSLEISLLQNGLYALYVLVMLSVFTLFNNTKGIYVCGALLVIILGNMYILNRSISENLHRGHDLDTSTESESDAESEGDSEEENAASILEDFKKVVNETTDFSEELGEIEKNTHAAAAEYDRVAREYTEIERIIQNVAIEYRQKAAAAREAASMAGHDSDAEARANAADEREYNED